MPPGEGGMAASLVLLVPVPAARAAYSRRMCRATRWRPARTITKCSATSAPPRSWASRSAQMPQSIWYQRAWSTTLKLMFDGLIYACLAAGTFGWLWPKAIEM